MKISVIATVYNEAPSLNAWLASLERQSREPDEIVITDGCSTDGTWRLLQQAAECNPRLVVFQARGNIATGRNQAIARASGEIIAVADAGCAYAADWLEKIVRPLEQGARWSATAFGPRLTTQHTLMEILIAAATTPAPREFKNDWLPSSRSTAFAKTAWQNAGGYPEWIPICEDIVFDRALIARGVSCAYVRQPLVFWEPRATIGAFMRQVFRYTRSDGHGNLWLGRQLVRYAVYGGSLALIITAADTNNPAWLLPMLFLAPFYMTKFWNRLAVFSKPLPAHKRLLGFMLLPVVVLLGDMAKMCGWPVGVYERLTGIIKKPR